MLQNTTISNPTNKKIKDESSDEDFKPQQLQQ